MLNPTRLKVYIRAYLFRLEKNMTIDEIDTYYKNLGKLKDDDIKQVHERLQKIH